MGYPNEDEGPDEVTLLAIDPDWENGPKKPEHTPLPWVGFSDDGKLVAIMPAGRPGDICTFAQSPSRPDGDLLLRSVNGIPDLIAALEKIAGLIDSEADEPLDDAINIARVALARIST